MPPLEQSWPVLLGLLSTSYGTQKERISPSFAPDCYKDALMTAEVVNPRLARLRKYAGFVGWDVPTASPESSILGLPPRNPD
jgi:hypothetical protein